MNFRRFIIRKLISGQVQPTPAVQRALQELDDSATNDAVPIKLIDSKSVSPEPAEKCDPRPRIIVIVRPARWVRCTGAVVASLLVLLLSNRTFAAGKGDAFEDADKSFAKGRYAEATRGFESILHRDGYSAPVLYNLANAQFRDGKVGPAILNYERALSLAPNDPDIVTNLKLARTKAGLWKGDPSRLWQITHTFTLGGWAAIAVVALLIMCVAVPLSRRLVRVRAACGLIGFFALVAVLGSVVVLAKRWPELNRAVVIGKECVARISPVTTAEAVLNLPEGETVIVRESHGNFARIQSRMESTGWVKSDEIEPVLVSAKR